MREWVRERKIEKIRANLCASSKNRREMQTEQHRINTNTQLVISGLIVFTYIDTHEEKVNGVHRRNDRIEA